MRMRVKICCINSVQETEMAVRYGASALGFVSEMPSGPGVISEEKIREIAGTVPPGVASFLLTSKIDVLDIIRQQRYCRCNTIQLVDMLPPFSHLRLKEALPGISIVQVVHVTGKESVEQAVKAADLVDAILLDSGDPNKEIKELGGTGRVHNWDLSREIVESVSKPVYLAGGLNSENATKAVAYVKPFGLDVCSGLRTNGELDEEQVKKFMNAVY